MKTISSFIKNNPLKSIVFIALILRLIAVIFAKGFGMHDDHFLVIEASQSWVDGLDYNRWLPLSGNTQPSGHSFFYVGLHYLILSAVNWFGIIDVEIKMFIIRLLHAIFSMITVVYGYKIAEKIGTKKSAFLVGLLMASFWIMPWLSVRNLVEFVCIPFLMISTWWVLNEDNYKRPFLMIFLAGIFLGLAVNTRFQSVFFVGGMGLALLFTKKWKQAFILGFGVLLSFGLVQGMIDYFIWGKPFTEFKEYINYNLQNAYNYITNPWYNYLLLILGLLIPPVSLFIFFGFFRSWKKHLLLFLPSFIFLLFHSYFPNKQERFIIPIIPFIMILGIVSWYEFKEASKFWNKFKTLHRSIWIFFWVINLILLPVITTMYSKKARVESMIYLSKYEKMYGVLLEDSNHDNAKMIPRFYLKQWVSELVIAKEHKIEDVANHVKTHPKESHPNFVLFFEDKNLASRIAGVKRIFPELTYETTIYPSLVDDVLHKLNPNNANQVIYIFKTYTSVYPTYDYSKNRLF